MDWKLSPAEYKPEEVVEIVNHHRLMPELGEEAASACIALHQSKAYVIRNGGEGDIAKVFVRTPDAGGAASIDLIPAPKFFRDEAEFRDDFRECMAPILDEIFENPRIRRVTAFIPYSRGRTKKALRSLGFCHEGRIRSAVLFRRKDAPEDLFVFGMTVEDYEKEYRNVV